jgi:hypothetical protein
MKLTGYCDRFFAAMHKASAAPGAALALANLRKVQKEAVIAY